VRGLGGRRVHSNKNVNVEAQKIGDQRRKTVAPAFCIPYFDDDILAIDVPKALELIANRLQQAGLHVLGDDAYAGPSIPLLRRFERRSEDGDPDQERPPANHSMVSA